MRALLEEGEKASNKLPGAAEDVQPAEHAPGVADGRGQEREVQRLRDEIALVEAEIAYVGPDPGWA